MLTDLRHEQIIFGVVVGIMCILAGSFMILAFLPGAVGERGVAVLMFFAGVWIFVGVALLIGAAILKATEGARRRESAMLDTGVKVEEVIETVHEGRELVGSCIVCKGNLYVGDSIVSCPRCKGIAHRGDLLEWVHVKGTCPACGRHLDEDQVQELPVKRKMK